MNIMLKLFALMLGLQVMASHAEDKVIYIYQDADLSHHIESSESIQKGIEVAFAEVDNQVAGYQVKFKYLNHRGNVIRSKRNYDAFLKDPNALAIYSGIHSPPLIKNRKYINENKALTLVPWAAGGPITRYPSSENWIFRLSVDDTQAGDTIIDFATDKKGCKSPHLLLESTPWGDSNLKSMTKALMRHNINNINVTRFGWNLGTSRIRTILRKVITNKDDCVVLVANAVEGVVIADAVLSMPEAKQLPIISHWGIVGGDFHKRVTAKQRKTLDLHFIQSCFAFTNPKQSPFAKSVFNALSKRSNGDLKYADLPAAVGFIHAYDLSKLLISAINQAGLTGDIAQDRNAIRLAMENLNTPIQGLVKKYQNPFSVFAKNKPNAHEALGKTDYCMGYFGDLDEVLLIQ